MAGLMKVGEHWYGFWRGPTVVNTKTGKPYRKTIKKRLSTDKTAAQAMLAKLLVQIERGKAGLVDEYKESKETAILQHLREFTAARHGLANHATVDKRIKTIIETGGIKTIETLTPDRVMAAITAISKRPVRGNHRVERLPTTLTLNHYLSSVKTFSKWLWESRRCEADPLARVRKFAAAMHTPVHSRRALTTTEIYALAEAARKSRKKFYGLAGPDRRLLYLVCSTTGLRAKEAKSLTASSFDLVAGTVTVEAKLTKNRKHATLPLHPKLIEELRPWLTKRKGLLWPGNWDGASLIRRDLKAAKIPYEDESGIADFHALRTSFISNLARANVPLVFAQKLARHSTPALTSNVYSRIQQHELAASVASLPLLPEVSK